MTGRYSSVGALRRAVRCLVRQAACCDECSAGSQVGGSGRRCVTLAGERRRYDDARMQGNNNVEMKGGTSPPACGNASNDEEKGRESKEIAGKQNATGSLGKGKGKTGRPVGLLVNGLLPQERGAFGRVRQIQEQGRGSLSLLARYQSARGRTSDDSLSANV